MEKFVLSYRKKIIGFIVFCLVFVFSLGPVYQIVTAQIDRNVIVSATIEEWIAFSVSTTDLTLDFDLVDSAGGVAIGTASTTLNIGTNSPNGWTLAMEGTNAGLEEVGTGTGLIATVGARTELAAGTNGYGATVQDLGAVGALTIPAAYLEAANFVGPVPATTTSPVASYANPHAATNVATFRVRAAASPTTTAGEYTDTITITASTII